MKKTIRNSKNLTLSFIIRVKTPPGLAGVLVAVALVAGVLSVAAFDAKYTGNPPIINIAPPIINIATRSFNTMTITIVACALALLRSPDTSYAPGRTTCCGRTLLLTLLLALCTLRGADAQCSGSTYSYGSGACASCAFGATFISSIAGCAPSATLTAGPIDTAFYLSGSALEGVAAFSTVNAPEGVSFAADAFGNAGGALVLASGSYLAADGATAPAALPTGNVAWSSSAWVKCQAPLGVNQATAAAGLEWGAPEGAPQLTAALAVGAYTYDGDGMVTTLAGSTQGYADGTGTDASFNTPAGVAVTSSGVIIVADSNNNRIRLVTPFGVVTTLAGRSSGYADGTGTNALFFGPSGVALTSSGFIVVADSINNRIRLVTPLGDVTTLAGSSQGYGDGAGTNARFILPNGVAVTSSGVIVVADEFNNCIRLVTPLGVVTTLAGGKIPGNADGTSTNARFYGPQGVAVTSSGAIVVADLQYNLIRLVTPLGVVTTLAGNKIGGYADGAGTNARFVSPTGVAVIPSTDDIVVADLQNNRIRLITPLGVVTTIAGSSRGGADGTGKNAVFFNPNGVAVTSSGFIVVTDKNNNRIRLITTLGVSLSIAACDSTWHHVAQTYSPLATPYTLSAFLDGALVLQLNTTIALPPAASTLRVGWSGDLATNGGSFFNGSLAELRIYNRTLSTAEVVALSQPPLASFANTIVDPALPTVGANTYSFKCAPGFVGESGVQTKTVFDNSWAWSLGVQPSCSLPSLAVGSGNTPLSPGGIAGISVLIVLLAGLALYIAMMRLRFQRQIEALTAKTTMASRALDRARLLALQASPNAPQFTINFETGTIRTVAELKGEAPAPSTLPQPASSRITRITTALSSPPHEDTML